MKQLENIYPDVFSVSIGGYLGKSYGVEWVDGTLHYEVLGCKPKSLIDIKPSPSDWQEFWTELDSIEIWNWKPEYDNPSILDGTSWDLLIEINNRKLATTGSNNYPPRFEDFLKALQHLIRGRKFY